MNTTLSRIWDEMYRTKGYTFQIRHYTHLMRSINRKISIVVIIASLVCGVTAIFPTCRLGTILAAVVTLIASLLKDLGLNLIQSEDDLKKLDEI